jgi:hypothetical protein
MTAPTSLGKRREGPSMPLEGWRVGLSISRSPDLAQRGFGEVHLDDAFVEISRHLLAAGASLAYGGDLRQSGFTDILFDLARSHVESGGVLAERIASFLSWPIYLDLSDDQRANLKKVAHFHPVAPPEGLKIDATKRIEPNSPDNRYVWSRCLTKMRKQINDHVNARVLLGGQVQGYKGKYPGIAEESFLAIKTGMPVFLIGAFGGCARAVIDAIVGGQPEEFTPDFQLRDPDYAAMVELYNRRIPELAGADEMPVDYKRLAGFFREHGLEALNNGLDEQDNHRLFTTIHIPEIVHLLLKGLVAAPKPSN